MRIVISRKRFWEQLDDGSLVPVEPPQKQDGKRLSFKPSEITTSTWLKNREAWG